VFQKRSQKQVFETDSEGQRHATTEHCKNYTVGAKRKEISINRQADKQFLTVYTGKKLASCRE
jgi:hypothetical protein